MPDERAEHHLVDAQRLFLGRRRRVERRRVAREVAARAVAADGAGASRRAQEPAPATHEHDRAASRARERRFIGGGRQNSIPGRGDRRPRHRNRRSVLGLARRRAEDVPREERALRRRAREAARDALAVAADRKDHRRRDAQSRTRAADGSGTRRTDGRVEETSADGRFTFVGDAEPVFLAEFWKAMRRFQRFVTFNGRGFDGPFLMLRSAVLGVAVDAQPRRLPLLPPAPHRPARGDHVLRRLPQVEPGLRLQGVRRREPEGARHGRVFRRARTTAPGGCARSRTTAAGTSRRRPGCTGSSKKRCSRPSKPAENGPRTAVLR